MSAAMAIPYLVLVVPFAAGLIGKASFLGAMHVLMLPCMYVAMVRRRADYEQDHRGHRDHRRAELAPPGGIPSDARTPPPPERSEALSETSRSAP